MAMFSNNFTPENPKKFHCEICNFRTFNKKDFKRHIETIKHNFNINQQKSTVFTQNYPKHCCINCGKIYKDNSGLWRHKKKCTNQLDNLKNDLANEEKQQQLIEYLLKENSEFKHLLVTSLQEQNKNIVELAKNAGNNTTTTTTNSHNTTNNFNLQFYLNETCKNAMNIMDFVSQLPVGIKHLEDTGRLGFAEGISKIFIDGLKQLNVTDRPIHCSDFKRETIYIKNNNEWNKDTDNKPILTNAIKHVAHKNIKQISEWTKIHPDYNDSSSKENDKYLKIVSESMSGISEEESNKNYSKIIKNIVKETVINKNND